MEGFVLDSTYNTLAVIDAFESFIWTDRYLGYGDFELHLPHLYAIENPIAQDNYLEIEKSNRYMIVETLEFSSDVENGAKILVSGRSLESLLERRVIWGTRTLIGNLQTEIQMLLNESIINPTLAYRRIPNFIFKASSDPAITSLTVNTTFIGDNLYDAIYILCEMNGLGFKVLPVSGGGFEFSLYKGVDRSFGQSVNPHVVFSTEYENLISSTYLESRKALKTAAAVLGASGITEVTRNQMGLQRKEIYIDASSISTASQLIAKGEEALAETQVTTAFEGEIDATNQFVYGTDFDIGDIVQVINAFGMETRSRVSEIVMSHNVEGISFYPTFITIED